MKLTDTHLVILNAAVQHKDGLVLPLPKSIKLNKASVARVLAALLKGKLIAEKPAAPGVEVWREAKDGGRSTLVITREGLKASGIDVSSEQSAEPQQHRTKGKARTGRATNKPVVKEGTKLAALVSLLGRKTGATIEEAVKTTGWQSHSVRGAISGALKKKLGLRVDSSPVEGRGRVYRIVA